jgi:hypothetical protein
VWVDRVRVVDNKRGGREGGLGRWHTCCLPDVLREVKFGGWFGVEGGRGGEGGPSGVCVCVCVSVWCYDATTTYRSIRLTQNSSYVPLYCPLCRAH